MKLFALFAGLMLAAQAQNSGPSPTTTAPVPLSTACGDIIDNADQFLFFAKDVYDCLISVPFNPAVASRFLNYYNDTLQFQTTLTYLKNPPSSYQQPAVDLLQGLDEIQRKIDQGLFPNQYAFEATLQKLIYSSHDAHLDLIGGILAPFTFASPFVMTSVSTDGVQLPKVYLTEDIREAQASGDSRQTSAITVINGVDATDYLSQLAAMNAVGGLEPHADWNQLMSSPVLDVQGYNSILEGYITFYPGENITVTLENGTTLGPEPFLAFYNGPENTGPLATGGDFYNFFVLGFYPASYDPFAPSKNSAPTPSASDTSTSSTPVESAFATPTSLLNPAYPEHPDIFQPDLGFGGVLTGYFLRDVSTAVLSIPSFQAFDSTVKTFSDTVSEFLAKSKEAGMKKVLIDLQQNGGGNTFLAIDTFKQFFPSIEPFAGSRLRAHPTADVLGTTFTEFYETQALNQTYFDVLTVSNWVSTYRINAETGRNFTSWAQLFGPHLHNGDYFTTTQRYNLSSPIIDELTSGGILVHGYDGLPAPAQPYQAEDIVILTDGLCSSTCALFMELMHHEAGVPTVVAGGRPATGPMQAPSGSRGAQIYSVGDLDADILVAGIINATADDILPRREEDVYIDQLTINLRDQIRQDEDTPLQFLYEAANCRIFYTLQTFNNFTNLWIYAADAIWAKPELCVAGSTGYASTNATPSTKVPPEGPIALGLNASHNIFDTIQQEKVPNGLPSQSGGQELDAQRFPQTSPGSPCDPSFDSCGPGGGLVCQRASECGGSFRCVKTCSASYSPCGSSQCQIAPNQRFGQCPIICNANANTGPDFASPTTPPLPPNPDGRSVRSGNLRATFSGGRY